MDLCDLLSLKIKEQLQMITLLEKELSNTRDVIKRKDRMFEDFRVQAAKDLAKATIESKETLAKLKDERTVESNKLKSTVRELELQLFKEQLKSKQLEESQKKILNNFAVSREHDVEIILNDMSKLKSVISKSLVERLKQ
ncbi:hypothetical protein HK100_002570 [Physocladia obscura]|uniref:Uncharacterized protein n=1 Tax=Physocladia obscura TaxID=109957 RepID=A0AAD5TBG3_9FUNG|nr:hypothetical protein HK100_002570 [Physocladia obscura]